MERKQPTQTKQVKNPATISKTPKNSICSTEITLSQKELEQKQQFLRKQFNIE